MYTYFLEEYVNMVFKNNVLVNIHHNQQNLYTPGCDLKQLLLEFVAEIYYDI